MFLACFAKWDQGACAAEIDRTEGGALRAAPLMVTRDKAGMRQITVNALARVLFPNRLEAGGAFQHLG